MSIVLAGGIKHAAIVAHLQDSLFGRQFPGRRNPLPAKADSAPLPIETNYDYRFSAYLSEEMLKSIGDHASYETGCLIPGSVNRKVVTILRNALNFLLNREIREKRGGSYTFTAESSSGSDLHEFFISGDVSSGFVDQVGGVVQQCIRAVAKDEKLFARKIKEEVNSLLLLDITGRRLVENAADDAALHDRIITLSEEITMTEAVTFTEVCALAEYIYPLERRWTLIQKP
jgi:hypothetical protein